MLVFFSLLFASLIAPAALAQPSEWKGAGGAATLTVPAGWEKYKEPGHALLFERYDASGKTLAACSVPALIPVPNLRKSPQDNYNHRARDMTPERLAPSLADNVRVLNFANDAFIGDVRIIDMQFESQERGELVVQHYREAMILHKGWAYPLLIKCVGRKPWPAEIQKDVAAFIGSLQIERE